jgi:oligopeptide/dipeptide ABC transporter ATP-binding protein
VKPLLQIRDLTVHFAAPRGRPALPVQALRGIDLVMKSEEVHALVGESGSGKTVTATCIMGLLSSPPGHISRGQLLYADRNLLSLPESERRRLRGSELAMIFQEPARYLNPAFTVGEQIREMLVLHEGLDKRRASSRVLDLLALAGLDEARRVYTSYPHQLSGGMKQRAMIAMAISCHPALLIADEPTTALDVTLQQQILGLLRDLKQRLAMGILFISHDLGAVRTVADRVSVIYAGKIVESAGSQALFGQPLHPYTRLLLASIPDASKRGIRLQAIPGMVPAGENIPPGCAFHPRCPLAGDICSRQPPASREHGGGGHSAACHMIGKPWKSLSS